ncbi:MAG: DUF2723 domain-containing protein [Chitinophagales bacterium]
MQKFKLFNNIFGWFSFLFAAVVYSMTMESSGSFWDCGEFISGCFKLQVVHPPGAPFFLMLGRIFTLFSGVDVMDPAASGHASSVAVMVNLMSALATAGAVMFTFWTTTALARKVVLKAGEEITNGQIFTIIGAGLIAATCATFVDSLWFSAVEGEVYALSQFFMSLIIWAMMKWDADDSPYADHWLVMIAYMTGLSIGVHLLSLLALPAIALIYYYKRFKTTLVGWLIAGATGMFILGFYMKFIISFTQSYLAGMDLFFVNSVGLGFNSGIIVGALLVIALLVSIIRFSHSGSKRDYQIALGVSAFYVLIGLIIEDSVTAKLIRLVFPLGIWIANKYGYEARRLANIAVLSIAFSYIGYLSYIMVPIRAIANPPINMNRPTDPFTIKSYVDREQYGDRPLVMGPDYTADPYDDATGYIYGGDRWEKNVATKQYDNKGPKQTDYQFRPEVNMFFPRMGFWQDESKTPGYRAWLNPEYNIIDRETREIVKTYPPSGLENANAAVAEMNKKEPGQDGRGRYKVKDAISSSDNWRFFFKYQLGFMYFRYLMWNFTGRQDDIQGAYYNDNGRWISGIPFIDNSHSIIGLPDWPQEGLSKAMLENKGRNLFFMIPFLIGLVGFFYTLFKHDKVFWIVAVLFVTTGILQIVYQNEPPIEPRERDYAVAGSFLTYCIWIGFGLIAIVEFLKKYIGQLPSAGVVFALCAVAPFLMGSQGWDDHNRHGRNTARDFARCYLESCQPNAVLFTMGDNDTYPLWYAQEVEGIRTDVRVINLSLLGVDWYIDQLNYKINDAAPLKMSCKPEQYHGSERDIVRYQYKEGLSGTSRPLSEVMSIIASDKPGDRMMEQGGGARYSIFFTRNMYMDIDSAKAAESNFVAPDERNQIVSRMDWTVNKNMLTKGDWMTLDIINKNFMERPIYFAVSVGSEAYLGLDKYFQLEGLTYRIVPKLNTSGSPFTSPVRWDACYQNMMTKFKFGGIAENKDIYLDENNLRMVVNLKSNFGRLAQTMLDKGQPEKAAAAIDYSLKEMPADKVPHSYFDVEYPEVYYRAGQKEKAHKLLEEMWAAAKDDLNYYRKVYEYTLNEATKAGDAAYTKSLREGSFGERREVRENTTVMIQLVLAAAKYENPDYYQTNVAPNQNRWLKLVVSSKEEMDELDQIIKGTTDPNAPYCVKLRDEMVRYRFAFYRFN